MRKIITLQLLYFITCNVFSQYAPSVGNVGTTAIYKDSSILTSWAKECYLQRGLQDISNDSLGYASAGDETSAIGAAGANGTVSLGDGGQITCLMENNLFNGPGPDFAVFENSFSDDFLELAFVEVSSDGNTFVRFPAHCHTDTSAQMGTFGLSNATNMHNLAGKYRALYGTPFDLEDLKDSTNVNIEKITHIRIIDVVGSIDNQYVTYDSEGNKINDPWPTPFPSSGFDLDAIGSIHQLLGIQEGSKTNNLVIYPNPVKKGTPLSIKGPFYDVMVITDVLGNKINTITINTNEMKTGVYFIQLYEKNTLVGSSKLVVE